MQRAQDSGHLDPRVVREITNLPQGALYFPRSKKSKKIKPPMYEIRLGDARGAELDKTEKGGVEGDPTGLGAPEWKDIMVSAVL